MLDIKIESGGLERALKTLKKKFQSTQTLKKLRERKEYVKPSVKRRAEIRKAVWKESQRNNDTFFS